MPRTRRKPVVAGPEDAQAEAEGVAAEQPDQTPPETVEQPERATPAPEVPAMSPRVRRAMGLPDAG